MASVPSQKSSWHNSPRSIQRRSASSTVISGARGEAKTTSAVVAVAVAEVAASLPVVVEVLVVVEAGARALAVVERAAG